MNRRLVLWGVLILTVALLSVGLAGLNQPNNVAAQGLCEYEPGPNSCFPSSSGWAFLGYELRGFEQGVLKEGCVLYLPLKDVQEGRVLLLLADPAASGAPSNVIFATAAPVAVCGDVLNFMGSATIPE